LGAGFAFALTSFLVAGFAFVFGLLIAFFANFFVTSKMCVLDKLSVLLHLALAWVN
jgi:hypothetical protein